VKQNPKSMNIWKRI